MIFEKFINNYFPELKIDLDKFEGFTLASGFSIQQQKLSIDSLLSWPPNVFLLGYFLLEYTDKYRLIVSPQKEMQWLKSDQDEIEYLVKDWNKLLESYKENLLDVVDIYNTPDLVRHLGNIFNKKTLATGVYDLFDNDPDFIDSLFKVVLSIDELFSSFDICNTKNSHLDIILPARELCGKSPLNIADNDPKFGIVTYKHCVPQTGLTLNNLTHNITCLKPSVKPRIIKNKLDIKENRKNSYHILFLPWPKEINNDSFKKSQSKNTTLNMDSYFDFFDYEPKYEIDEKEFISIITESIKRVGTIDLIVLPECALSETLFDKFKATLFECFKENAPSLLSGVYGKDNEYSKNIASLAFISDNKKFEKENQSKHHRWFLDKNQLRNYNLSHVLDPNKKWWENIRINRRHLLCLHTKNGVRLCPLICEDLARQEPVAQAVRSVGPNLVISLLLDGPQISVRWPGKYSAVLSDDPGSSVLSVSALGMTLKSTGLGHKPSYDVALWSEPGKTPETLTIPSDADGLIIELQINKEKMWTMDGRGKDKVVLRKLMHTPVNISDNLTTVSTLKKNLIKELKKGA